MTFTVVITEGPATRWSDSPDKIAHQLGILAESLARINTTGPVPSVVVHHDYGTPFRNEPCKRCHGQQPGAGA